MKQKSIFSLLFEVFLYYKWGRTWIGPNLCHRINQIKERLVQRLYSPENVSKPKIQNIFLKKYNKFLVKNLSVKSIDVFVLDLFAVFRRYIKPFNLHLFRHQIPKSRDRREGTVFITTDCRHTTNVENIWISSSITSVKNDFVFDTNISSFNLRANEIPEEVLFC